MPKYDLCVIGGGPAGMMAAGRAAEKGKKVVLIEKNNKLGQKLLLTGGGRCNLTHVAKNNKEFVSHIEGNADFLLSALNIFDYNDLVSFFKKRNVKIVEEEGKFFPKSGKAREILSCLEDYLREGKVKILFDAKVIDFALKENQIEKVILENEKEIEAESFLIATGGKSYPQTGSTGDGYNFAKKVGHLVSELEPALTPLETKEKWTRRIQGTSLENIDISINKEKKAYRGNILFTHFGVSGPLILNLSSKVNIKDNLFIDLIPDYSFEDLDKILINLLDKNGNKKLKNVLMDFLKERVVDIVIEIAGIKNEECRKVTKENRYKLIKVIKKLKLTVSSKLNFDKAMITKGGINLKELNSNLNSKLIKNLYFAGEVVDLIGETGGYNLQICFTTGYVVGESFS